MSIQEKYRAEFTTTPIVIAFLPGIIFFSLMLSAATYTIWGGLFAGVPLTLLMLLLRASIKRSSAIVFSDSFEYSTSLLSKNVRRIEASKIESVDYRESVIGKGKWGSVTVRGAGIRALALGNIKHPEKLAEALRSIASSPVPKNSSGDTTNLASNLGELNKLMSEGVITKEEFEKAKSKLLNS
jgi:hypothetical protein